ncbi:MAG: hypothetical protein ABIQ75_06000 [Flavobacteriales bacterium]
MTSEDLAWHMYQYARALRHEWVTPNAMLYAWESDLLTVTPQRHVCEVEIKISRGDLLNDLKKPKHSQGMLMNGSFMHKRNAKGTTPNELVEDKRRARGETACRRPNYFVFAMPCAVYRKLKGVELPPYAGVYTVDDEGRVFEERRAIQLHTEAVSVEDLLGLARRMHHRYWNAVGKTRSSS